MELIKNEMLGGVFLRQILRRRQKRSAIDRALRRERRDTMAASRKWCLKGLSLGQFEGQVIDKYEYHGAKRTLDWAAACAAKDAYKAEALHRAQAAEK